MIPDLPRTASRVAVQRPLSSFHLLSASGLQLASGWNHHHRDRRRHVQSRRLTEIMSHAGVVTVNAQTPDRIVVTTNSVLRLSRYLQRGAPLPACLGIETSVSTHSPCWISHNHVNELSVWSKLAFENDIELSGSIAVPISCQDFFRVPAFRT